MHQAPEVNSINMYRIDPKKNVRKFGHSVINLTENHDLIGIAFSV